MYSTHSTLKSFLTLLTSLSLFLAGCTSMQTVPLNPANLGIHANDEVRVTTKDGREYAFKITSIESGTLQGGPIAIAYDDIVKVQARRFSGVKTTLLVAGIGGGIALFAAVLSAEGASLVLASAN